MKQAVLFVVASACALFLIAPWLAIGVMACLAAVLENAWRSPQMTETGRIIGPSLRDQARPRRSRQRRRRPF